MGFGSPLGGFVPGYNISAADEDIYNSYRACGGFGIAAGATECSLRFPSPAIPSTITATNSTFQAAALSNVASYVRNQEINPNTSMLAHFIQSALGVSEAQAFGTSVETDVWVINEQKRLSTGGMQWSCAPPNIPMCTVAPGYRVRYITTHADDGCIVRIDCSSERISF